MMTQQEALTTYMPLIEAGKVYEKYTIVEARPAVVGEMIVTVTQAGQETKNTAKAGDFVVKNKTIAAEEYILPAEKFTARYIDRGVSPFTSGWRICQAIGQVKAAVYTGADTEFTAPWDEGMQLHTGDMICTPLPQKGEVYRIAAQEFSETYRLKTT